MQKFLHSLEQSPVIASVRDIELVGKAVSSSVPAIFLLGGTILNLQEMVDGARVNGKRVFIHLDLLGGLGRDVAAVEWCMRQIRPDGVISTRAPLLKKAGEMGAITIQRLFVMDSSSLQHGINVFKSYTPDMLEVLPGLVPKAISILRQEVGIPIIAGGMITQDSEVQQALDAGAIGVSTSVEALWRYQA